MELIFILLGGLIIVGGVISGQRTNRLVRAGKITKAIVHSNTKKTSTKDSSSTYYPVVRFLTEQQVWVAQELSIGYSSPLKEGSNVEVIYDPEEPTHVQLNTYFSLHVVPKILVAVGVILFIVGALHFLGIFELNHSPAN